MLAPPRARQLPLPLLTWARVLVPSPCLTAMLSRFPFLPQLAPRPQLTRRTTPPLRVGGAVNVSMLRAKPSDCIDDGVATARSERLSAMMHRRVEEGRAECEWSSAPYCCPPLHRPSPSMHYRYCRLPWVRGCGLVGASGLEVVGCGAGGRMSDGGKNKK